MSYGTLGLPRPKPPGSPPPVPITSSSSEYDNSTWVVSLWFYMMIMNRQEDNTPIPHAKSAPSTLPTPAQNHPTEDVQSLAQQLKEVKDRLTRQVHEITVLKRELDDKYRIELELKTDLEMERSKEKVSNFNFMYTQNLQNYRLCRMCASKSSPCRCRIVEQFCKRGVTAWPVTFRFFHRWFL